MVVLAGDERAAAERIGDLLDDRSLAVEVEAVDAVAGGTGA
jgi:hypothetical protein